MPGVRSFRARGVNLMFARWRAWWRRHCGQEAQPARPVNGKGAREAQAALNEARADLLEAEKMAAQNQAKIETLRRINEENHFAAWAWKVFEGGRSR